MFPTLDELDIQFKNESLCCEYLESHNVFYKNLDCFSCEGKMRRIGERKILRCAKCRKQLSLRVHTIFYGSRLECRKILQMGYFWLAKATHQQISIYSGFSRQTVTDYMRYFRQLVASTLNDEDTLIGEKE